MYLRVLQAAASHNIEMPVSDWDLERGEDISGYHFVDRDILKQALQSATKDLDPATGQVIQSDGNRRLSKLGLKAIEFVLAKDWFMRGLDHGMLVLYICSAGIDYAGVLGEFDMIQKTVVSKDFLCDSAQQKGLQRCLSMSQRQENTAAPPNTMKLALTALVGAVWLDSRNQDTGNVESVRLVMQRLG